MRTFAMALFAFAIAYCGTLPLRGYAQSNSGININIQMGITGINVSQTDINNVVYSLQHAETSTGNWISIPNNSSVYLGDIFSDGSTGGGNCLNFATRITDTSGTFNLNSVGWSLSSLGNTFSGTFGGQGITYDFFGIGINYGPDGIPGTADDVMYTSGSGNAPVNEVDVIGMYGTLDTSGLSPSQAFQTWASSYPFNMTTTYTLNGVSATNTMNITTNLPIVPNIIGITVNSNVPTLTLSGQTGSTYVIQCIDSFNTGAVWTTIASITMTNTSQPYREVSATNHQSRYYRLMKMP